MAVSAQVTALKILSRRAHSEFEVRSKLADKRFDKEDIDAAIEYLHGIDLLDDRAFTKSWIAYRLARPFGFKRIAIELRQKGVDQSVIDEATEPFKQSFDQQVVVDLARRRASRLTGIDPAKRKKRIFDFLLRRGFSHELILKALKQL